MRIENLTATRQKSYYGKAKIIFEDNGVIKLQSYDTVVARIENGKFIKMWGGWSATTMNHILDFCKQFEIPSGNKKWWCELPCEDDTLTRYRVVGYNVLGMDYKPTATFDSYEQAEIQLDKMNENKNPFWFYDIEEV